MQNPGAGWLTLADMPNHAAMSAVAPSVGGSGAIRDGTIVLMEPEELDDDAKLTPSYSPPGT